MKFKLQTFKSKIKKIENEACLNCGQPFSGHEQFCSYCGQKNTNKKLTFGTFINNLVSGFFSYDSRFWSTFIPLLTKPGQVSKDYIEGKRARFVNPFQLYLNISIIFFLILGISNRGNQGIIPFDEVVTASQSLDSLKQINQQQIDSIAKSTQEEVAKKAPNDSTSTKVITNLGDVFKLTQTENIDSLKTDEPYQYHIEKDTLGEISLVNKLDDFQHFITNAPNLNYGKALDSLGYEKTFWNTFFYQQIANANLNVEQMKIEGEKNM